MTPTTLSIPTPETDLVVGPCEWSPDELRTRVAQEQELRSIIVEYYRSQMIEKKHYYLLPGGHKPALSKEGALNLCSLFKVRVSAQEPLEAHHEDGHYSVRYRVCLVSMRTGEDVADGDGFCSTRESKYAYRWVKVSDVPGTVDTTTLARRTTRYGQQVRVSTPDLADHYNTVLKMACKRAIVAAALCLPLVSELFTQNLAQHATPLQSPPPPSSGQRQRGETLPAHTQTAAAPPDAAPMAQQITPEQMKRLWSQINLHQVDHEAFRAHLKQVGLQSTKALMPTQLDQCLSEINARQGQAFQPHNDANPEADTPTQGTRAQLFEALKMIQAVIAETEETQPPGEPYAETLIELAQWIPRVARACENPDTPKDQLKTYLLEVNESLDQLQQMALTEAAA